MQLKTYDPTVEAMLTHFTFSVDVPDRDDHYVNLSVPSGGLTLSFQPDGAASPVAFNGGPGSGSIPAVQVTILNATAGDDAIISSVTLSGCTIQVKNGGVSVLRTINALVQGY